jgi:hypothetical protein
MGTGRKAYMFNDALVEEKYAATMHMVSVSDAELLGIHVVRGVA